MRSPFLFGARDRRCLEPIAKRTPMYDLKTNTNMLEQFRFIYIKF